MKLFIAVTNEEWFFNLRSIKPDEVNFWQPLSQKRFNVLDQGEILLFKLHYPNNYIVGGGVFIKQSFLPLSMTWDAFGIKNGTSTEHEFRDLVYSYRKTNKLIEPDPMISSLILVTPFFFNEVDWIPIPKSWSSNIVTGKSYDTSSEEGREIYELVKMNLEFSYIESKQDNRYGEPQIIASRLGQGAFRVIVTDTYNRKCAISGEKTLPVLNASHIKPFAQDGPHVINNGLLLRQDIHTLFDRGYITIGEDSVVEVSKHIKEDYGNGKEYYAFHGKPLLNLPDRIEDRPSKEFLLWHNENVYVG